MSKRKYQRVYVNLFSILVNRASIFFFSMCLLTLFIYGVGTRQGFVDSTQLSLLKLYVVLGLFLSGISFSGIVAGIVRFFRSKKVRYLARAGAYLFLTIFGIISVLVIMFILTITRGKTI